MILSIFLGALLAVAVIPSARSTVAAEIVMALGRRPEWARVAAGGSWPRLRQAAAARPRDVALQIGLETLPSREAVLTSTDEPGPRGGAAGTVRRLEALAQRFPGDASIRAHLLRFMTVELIRIDRSELAEFALPAPKSARRLPRQKPAAALGAFLAAASEGARLEPKNAYFDAMRAAAEFAADRDTAALRDWHAAASKPEWDDHATEETRAQWKLLDAAYGEHGVIQKSPGFEHMLFPHFAELRHAAQLAVWHAVGKERAGDGAAARSIRHDVMKLGMTMAHASPLLVGQYVGLAIFEIGTSPVRPEPARSFASREAMLAARRARQQRYEKALQAHGEIAEADWVRAQREHGERLQSRLDQLRDQWDAAAPSGFSPERWEGWWSFGILMLEQIGLLLALWGGAALLARPRETAPAGLAPPAATGALALAAALLVTAAVVSAAAPAFVSSWHSLDLGMGLRLAAALVILLGAMRLLAWHQERGRNVPRGSPVPFWAALFVAVCLAPGLLYTATASDSVLLGGVLAGIAVLGALGLAGRAGGREARTEARPRWKPGLVALFSILPSTALIFLERDALSLSPSLATRLLVTPRGMWPVDPQFDPGRVLPALLVLPLLLLLLFQLCRVVALRLPLRSGMARGLRQTAPAAIGILLALYLAALVPTISHDRAAVHRLDRMLTDELSWSPGGR